LAYIGWTAERYWAGGRRDCSHGQDGIRGRNIDCDCGCTRESRKITSGCLRYLRGGKSDINYISSRRSCNHRGLCSVDNYCQCRRLCVSDHQTDCRRWCSDSCGTNSKARASLDLSSVISIKARRKWYCYRTKGWKFLGESAVGFLLRLLS